ncbi:MAG: endonuclease MutS2 [Gemmatimonadota bacterium]
MAARLTAERSETGSPAGSAGGPGAHALTVLQFREILDVVAGFASSRAGAQRIGELVPVRDRGQIEAELSRVAAMRALISGDDGWTPHPIPDVADALSRLAVAGTVFSGLELRDAAALLRTSRLTRDALGADSRPAVARGVLADFRQRLHADSGAEQALERAIDADGSVRDEASHALRKIRRELRGAEGELIALLDRIIARLEPHHRVSDASVTVRNGRYVIPVRREGRGSVGGLVHDASGSGATLFMEPPAAVEATNRIRELEADEHEEVDRILHELTGALRPAAAALSASLEALITLDALYARGRYAERFDCHGVRLRDPGSGFRIVNGRHPLLLAQGGTVVPFDLEMAADERTLCISGPNTGGKTVLLKAIGLISLLVQAGVPAPASAASEIAIHDDFFADIGDEQSIEASLSTFSAHLRNLGDVLRSAGPTSLVLIDELGSGTDPLEGAALGGAILEALTSRRTLTLATTHLGALKDLAGETGGIVNASLEFDAALLAPTYRLIKGIPGRSYGLSIARRLDLPADVLDRAEARVPAMERDVNALLAALEARDKEMTERAGDLEQSLAASRERAARLAERETRVRERERSVERESRKEARRYVLEARRLVERTIADLRRAAADSAEAVAREARRTLEEVAESHNKRVDQLEREELNVGRRTTAQNQSRSALSVGDTVAVDALDGRLGRVTELREATAVVTVGAVRMTWPRTGLQRVEAPPPSDMSKVMTGDLPEVTAATEIDLRGMRVDELDENLLQAIDAVVRADLHSLRIIHGKGTGALRARVAEMLQKDTRVRSFRLGLWNEGGAGVTVAEL